MKNNIIYLLSLINNKIWIITTIIIVLKGFYFTIKLTGIQFNIKKMIKELFKNEKSKNGLSSFKTLMLSLAGRIGVGSISGISLAIYITGPGSIFWIWLISLISAPLTYAETYLGIKYREKDSKNDYKSCPTYYLKNALNNHKLGAIYSIIIIICYIIGFISIQSNTITKSITSIITINPIIIGIILSILTFIIIFGEINKIANATSKIVPVMTLIYILLAIYIILTNINEIPNIFKEIIKGAFNFKSLTGGFLATMLIGVQRGIFSNEAGIGTGSIAASSGNSNEPQSQGYIQIIGICITSLLICTATAIIILTSNYNILNITDPNGIEIATNAFKEHIGSLGNIILIISILLFAFSTILSGYYYGETSLKYFFKNKKGNNKYITILKILSVSIIFLGSIFSPTIIWNFTDVFVAILALINIYAIFKLKKEIKNRNIKIIKNALFIRHNCSLLLKKFENN